MLTRTVKYRFFPDILEPPQVARERDLAERRPRHRHSSSSRPGASAEHPTSPSIFGRPGSFFRQASSKSSSSTTQSGSESRSRTRTRNSSQSRTRRTSFLNLFPRSESDTQSASSNTSGDYHPIDDEIAMSFADRPTHISLPPSAFSPSRSPMGTPPAQSAGPASPTSPRHSFLGFIRTRGRSSTLGGHGSPAPGQGQQLHLPALPITPNRSRADSMRDQSVPVRSRNVTGDDTANGSASAGGAVVTRTVSTPLGSTVSVSSPRPAPSTSKPPSKAYRIRLVPHLESNRTLPFDPVIREMAVISVTASPGTTPSDAASRVADPVKAGTSRLTVGGKPIALVLKIGRFTDKAENKLPVPPSAPAGSSSNQGYGGSMVHSGEGTLGPDGSRSAPATLTVAGGGGELTSSKVAFRSKVVSRAHAEIWCEEGGKFYIRDTKSSSGTFLNHIRLSSPNTDSRPMSLNDGDVLQLGVDYQGGKEEMFKCVKMRVEVGREWQRGANEFNTNALKQITGGAVSVSDKGKETPGKKAKANVTDCCICLFSVTVCQSLFIAPCSHVFHYKCIRPLLMQHYPGFSCPLCRTFANLEDDVETEDAWDLASRRASVISRRPSDHSLRAAAPTAAGPSVTVVPQSGDEVTTSAEGGAESGISPSPDMADSTSPVHLGVDADIPPTVPGDAVIPSVDYTVPPSDTAPRPILNNHSIDTASTVQNYSTLSEAATPMNDTFLSTLALAPGMLQRLELAEEMSSQGGGTRTAAGSISTGEGSRRASGESEPHVPEQGDLYT